MPLRIVLASASPRRRELLGRIVPDFEVCAADVDEAALTLEDPWETAEGLALAKARVVAAEWESALIIGGDTVVAFAEGDGYRQLAKPLDEEDARAMLSRLSGREHLVITGIALVSPQRERVFSETTRVTFRVLEEGEIRDYVATGEPTDKAGAYAIQGGAAAFVDSMEGSLTNVIGLPTEALERELKEFQKYSGPDS